MQTVFQSRNPGKIFTFLTIFLTKCKCPRQTFSNAWHGKTGGIRVSVNHCFYFRLTQDTCVAAFCQNQQARGAYSKPKPITKSPQCQFFHCVPFGTQIVVCFMCPREMPHNIHCLTAKLKNYAFRQKNASYLHL